MVAAAPAPAPVELFVLVEGVVPEVEVAAVEPAVPAAAVAPAAPPAAARPVICTWCPTCDARSLLLRNVQDIVASLFATAPAAAAAGPRLPVVVVLAVPAVVPLVPVAAVLDVDPGVVDVLVLSVVVVDALLCVEALGLPPVASMRARFSTYVPFGARSTHPVRLIRSAGVGGVGC